NATTEGNTGSESGFKELRGGKVPAIPECDRKLQTEVCGDLEGTLPGAFLPRAGHEAPIGAEVFQKSVDGHMRDSAGLVLKVSFEVNLPGGIGVGDATVRINDFDVLHRRRIRTGVDRAR